MSTETLPGIFFSSRAHFDEIKNACPYSEVISLVEVELPLNPTFTHHYLPAQDWLGLESIFDTAFDILDRASETHKILVHCQMGSVRCPTLIMAYIINRKKLSTDEAYAKMQNVSRTNLPYLRKYANETQ